MGDLVVHECSACGPVLETFSIAVVICRCGRARLPTWVKAQAKRRTEQARRDSWHEGAGQNAVSRDRGVSARRSRGRVSGASRSRSGRGAA
jgi:hypothetical protein